MSLELFKVMNSCLKMNILAVLMFLAGRGIASAQEKCSVLFLQGDLAYLSEPWRNVGYEKYDGRLSAKALKSANLSVAADGETLMMGDHHIGTLKILRAKYLFQWADAEIHQGLTKYGAHEGYIKAVLQQPPQAAGRGFYVSRDPGDSASFGQALTVFRPQQPLVILEYFFGNNAFSAADIKAIETLASLGIDGLRYGAYRDTWLSIIHHRNLGFGEPVPIDAVRGYWDPSQAKRYMDVGWMEKIPQTTIKAMDKDTLVRRILLDENYTMSEGIQFYSNYSSSMSEALINRVMKNLAGKLEKATYSEMVQFYELAQQRTLIPKESLYTAPQGPQLRYQALLDLYGIADIAALKNLKTASTRWKEMATSADRYVTARSRLSLSKIKTAQDLMDAAKKIYGHSFAFRKQSSSVVYPVTTRVHQFALNHLLISSVEHKKTIELKHWSFDGSMMSWAEALSPKVRTKLSSKAKDKPKVTSEVLQNLVEQMIANPRAAGASFRTEIRGGRYETARDFYKFFFELQPFESNNTQVGRLFFEVIREKMKSNEPDLAISDQREQLVQQFYKEATSDNVLDVWVRGAKSDAEFISRARQALELSRKSYESYPPESTTHWSY